MNSQLNPYLSFKDNARQAMEFYKSVFGGELTVSTFKEFHASNDPKEDNKVMHAMLKAPNGIVFMASDTPNHMKYDPGTRISMSLSGDDQRELTGYFEKLAAGGTTTGCAPTSSASSGWSTSRRRSKEALKLREVAVGRRPPGGKTLRRRRVY
jgi:PhnB protein